MPAKRLRVLRTFTREPDEIVVRTTRHAIAGLKEKPLHRKGDLQYPRRKRAIQSSPSR